MSEDHTAEETTGDGSGISRRRLVATGAATWATVSAAGCSRIDDPNQPIFGEEPTDTETPTEAPTNTTVTNETTTTEDPSSGGEEPTPTETECASIRQFAPGMEIGLQVSVYETDTGKALGDGDLEGVKLEFPDADLDTQELSWSGDHEDHDANSWGGKIETGEDIESGTYQYEVVVEGGDGQVTEDRITDQFTIV